MKLTSKSRIGDIAEFYAVTWLWDQGYEVFLNPGSSGVIDMVCVDLEGNVKFLDIKSYKDTNLKSRTDLQKKLNVRYVHFNPETRKCRFVEHKE
jgi:hypothetical protein